MSKAVIIPECNKDIVGVKDELSLSPNGKKDGPIGLFSRLLRFDSISKRNSTADSPTATEPPITYYGVYIPCEIKKGPDEEALHVYKNKSEALELVRRYKLARFKAFQNRQDAVSFALRGAELSESTDGNDNSLMGEKPYPFKAPSPQDMVALRKAIEAGLICTVRERVWDNPRYLVSSGNTPAILQEGSRYNALHIAAKAQNAEICNLILTTVGNPSFVQKLYGMDADAESCKEFASILVDRYLNTPDKAMNETPLHFAAKFGGEQAVDVLTSFPQCHRGAVNKFGEQAKDIICKRSPNSCGETIRRIAAMLQERYYVPVLHTEDESAVPTIGKPFTPAVPPELNHDPLSPRYEIRAFAGPMEANDAENFRRRWKTPPRVARLAPATFRLREMTKGLETVGRDLAEQMKVGWKEYWPFLDTFTDLRTPEGLALLENYLKAKYESACSFVYSDSCNQSQRSVDDLSISRISVSGQNQQETSLNQTMSPMSELCAAMKSCTISSDRPSHWKKTDPVRQRLCRQPSIKLSAQTNGEPMSTNHTVNQLLCIERTCQVFATRIVNARLSLTSDLDVAREFLKSEAKHLQHTIFTYMDDERFQKINFAVIHSRIAQLILYMLRRHSDDLEDINLLVNRLRSPNEDIFSSDDERKPINYRGSNRVKISQIIDGHVRCLASFISEELETEATKGPATSESECSNIWEKASKCRCDWKIELFERNSKKNASFRKNRSILSTSPKNDSVIRKLIFDHDIGDSKQQQNDCVKPMSMNSPAGDSSSLYTLDTSKCQVVEAQISDDESGASTDSDDEVFHTASEHSDKDDDNDENDQMANASDRALAEPFIYGEEPTKMDRLVFDAVSQSEVCPVRFPHVYRWRHTVALYSPSERDKWHPPPVSDESTSDRISVSFTAACSPVSRGNLRLLRLRGTPARCSTPNRDIPKEDGRAVPLQVSTWLRVTGPNSPRSALATKNVNHNVSFGFRE